MRLLFSAAVAAVLVASSAAQAAEAVTVRFNGCPMHGVEHGCVVIKSGADTYDITAAAPPIAFKGLGIEGSGTVSSKVSFCMQGKILEDIHYSYTRLKCPKQDEAKKPAAKTPEAKK